MWPARIYGIMLIYKLAEISFKAVAALKDLKSFFSAGSIILEFILLDKQEKYMNGNEGLPLKYFIFTFGCQMNEHDSEVMAGILENEGYRAAQVKEEADLLLINTCCIRETAENKVYGLLGKLRKLKQAKPSLMIGLGGCMTQQESAVDKIKRRFSYVDFVFGTYNTHHLGDLLAKAKINRKTVIEVLQEAGPACEILPARSSGNNRAWVVITHGCNNYCTYCIVPYVRGRERSRSPEDIIKEIENLVTRGYKEVTLLGQNVNSYGRDLQQNIDFAGLLEKVNRINNLERIRFVTSHPRDFTSRLIETISICDKVCEFVHLPVQAGSNHVLQMMNRGYTREYYLELVERIRRSIPGVAITTDIMVGFPGESDEDFSETLDLVEKIRFDSAFTFIYNKRSGTPAALMSEQISAEKKRERIKILIKKQNQIAKEINLNEVGKKHQILIEGKSKNNPEFLSGRSRTNKLVICHGSPHLIGKLAEVEITGGGLTHLEGKLLGT